MNRGIGAPLRRTPGPRRLTTAMAILGSAGMIALTGSPQTPAAVTPGESAATPRKVPGKSRTFPHINPPPLPPVAQFNQLLRATPAERTNQLVGKTEAARGLILRELSQFDQLTGVEREQRILQLRVAQLRYFLRPLLQAPATERARLLATTPEEDRVLLESRLAVWDTLPAETRQEVLESDQALQHFVRQASRPPGVADATTAGRTPVVSSEVHQSWDHWQALSPDERSRREGNFQRFFNLTPDEQIRAIGGLPSVERQRMEHALTRFNQLPPARRDLCVQNFDRLARLPEAERADFLRNAARWEAMTQAEREAWRRLIVSVPPPPMPPIPPNVAGRQ